MVRWGGLLFLGLCACHSPAVIDGGNAERGGELTDSNFGAQGISADAIIDGGAGGSGPSGESRFLGGEHAQEVCKSERPLQVLFIGNSYTHYNDMPSLLEGLAASAGCRVEAEMVAPGGSRLNLHARSGETLAAIGERAWDAVILQNYSQLPSQPPEVVRQKTFDSVGTLVSAIRQNHPATSIYYYVTWGRRDGDSKFCATNPMVCTFEGHTAALERGYQMYAETFGGRLVDVGGAWARASGARKAPFSRAKLYDPDGSHPSLHGSYLAASVFFATLFSVSPQGLAYPEGLSDKEARFIQQIAGTIPVSGA